MQEARALFFSTTGDRPDLETGSILFIGNATTLIRYAGFTILTPNFLHRHDVAHLGYGVRSKRLANPALELHDLPPVDFVLLSHFHEDHFERVVIRNLDTTLPVVTTAHGARALRQRGFRSTHALNTWEAITIAKGAHRRRITAVPGRHGPGVVGHLLPPVMGSVLEWQSPHTRTLLRLPITGDTLVYRDIKQIPQRYPNIDLALLHLGGARALGILVTMDAKQGVEMILIINPTVAIPVHYNDYDVMKSSLDDLQREGTAAGLEDRMRYLDHGDTYAFGVPTQRMTPAELPGSTAKACTRCGKDLRAHRTWFLGKCRYTACGNARRSITPAMCPLFDTPPPIVFGMRVPDQLSDLVA